MVSSLVAAADAVAARRHCLLKCNGVFLAHPHKRLSSMQMYCLTLCCCVVQVLHDIGEKHGVSPSCVADRWVLQQPGVSAIILGARNANHLRVSSLTINVCEYAQPISSSSSSNRAVELPREPLVALPSALCFCSIALLQYWHVVLLSWLNLSHTKSQFRC